MGAIKTLWSAEAVLNARLELLMINGSENAAIDKRSNTYRGSFSSRNPCQTKFSLASLSRLHQPHHMSKLSKYTHQKLKYSPSNGIMTRYNRLFRPFKYFQDRYAGHPFRLLVATIKFTFAAHVFCEFAYVPVPAWGPSMLPTFEVLGDWLLISRQYRRGRGIEVGDLVTFDSVVEPGERAIKRVLGLEGDYVMRDTPGTGSTEMLQVSQNQNSCRFLLSRVQVPKGHCWVIGDNLAYSRDSRHFGPMPMALIKGKVIAKILPWGERRWIVNNVQPVTES